MKYKCTLLKDLPNYDAGTVFYVQDSIWDEIHDYYCRFPEDKKLLHPNYKIDKSTIDNPNWVKKEPDYENLNDISCPNCGGTEVLLMYQIRLLPMRILVQAECPCGKRYDLIKESEVK